MQENAVDGRLLAGLSDDDLASELGMKPLQIRKLRARLDELVPGAVMAAPAATEAHTISTAAHVPAAAAAEAAALDAPAAAPAPAQAAAPLAAAAAVAAAAPAAAVVAAHATAPIAPAPIAPVPVATAPPQFMAAPMAPMAVPMPQGPMIDHAAYQHAQRMLHHVDADLAQASRLLGSATTTQVRAGCMCMRMRCVCVYGAVLCMCTAVWRAHICAQGTGAGGRGQPSCPTTTGMMTCCQPPSCWVLPPPRRCIQLACARCRFAPTCAYAFGVVCVCVGGEGEDDGGDGCSRRALAAPHMRAFLLHVPCMQAAQTGVGAATGRRGFSLMGGYQGSVGCRRAGQLVAEVADSSGHSPLSWTCPIP